MSSTCRNSRRGLPVPQITTSSSTIALSFVEPTDQCGQDVAVFGVEIVARPIQVGWHHRAVINPVLTIVAFTKFDTCNLGYGIGFVGGLQYYRLARHPRAWVADAARG